MGCMDRPQISVLTLLLLVAALPIWLALVVVVPLSPGFGGGPFRFVVAPLVLGGITVAIHRLVSRFRSAWGLSALTAAVIALGSLSVAAWLTS